MVSSRGSSAATTQLLLKRQQARALLEVKRRTELRQKVDQHARLIDLDLLDFVPALLPRYERPEHLAPIAEFFDRVSRGESLRWLISAPPQFGKSECMGAGVARYIARHPDRPVIYGSYGADLAERKSRTIRDHCSQLGVELRADANAVSTWLTPEGGGFLARGIGGSTTGNPAKLVVIDDPHKDREEAESALLRQKVFDWYSSVISTRCHPDSSILVAHARWHDEDLIGQLKELKHPRTGEPLFRHINLPAIDADRKPLWHQRPLEFLEPFMAQEHDWWSLWMGQPRKRGERVFKGVHYYDRLPHHFSVGKGLDLAYTSRKSSHHSAGVVLLEDTDRPTSERRWYVVDVRRHHGALINRPEIIGGEATITNPGAAEDFVSKLQSVIWPGAWHWFTSSTERGVADLLTDKGIPVEAVLATADKFSRAQPVAAEWNQGRILVPREAPWLREFVDEVGSFTGVSDKSDDQCVAKGTLVETATGARAIEAVLVGEEVWTREGLRRVSAAGQTSVKARVFDVEMSDGRVLTATANHPVFVVGKGFTRVDALTSGDEVVVRCQSTSVSSSTGTSSTDTQSRTRQPTSGTFVQELRTLSEALRRFIGKSGSSITERFRMECRSITRTRTLSTTQSRTLSACLPPNTERHTQGPRPKCSALTWIACATWLRIGIDRLMGWSGIDSTAGRHGLIGQLHQPLAWLVATCSRLTSQPAPSFALSYAGNVIEPSHTSHRTSIRVRSAVQSSGPLRQSGSAARPHVVTVCERPESVPVYNLSVEGAPEYFANGVLVHNCDALASAFEGVRYRHARAVAVSGAGSRYEADERGFG